MDEDILRAKGLDPKSPRKAVAPGYRLRIGQRAMLAPQFGAQAFGMVFTLTNQEIESLYAQPGLEMYRPESLVVTFEDGTFAAVTAFNLNEAIASTETNSDYAAKLRVLLERLGFPSDYIQSIGLEGNPPITTLASHDRRNFKCNSPRLLELFFWVGISS